MWKTVRGIAIGSFGISLVAIATGWNPFAKQELQKPVEPTANLEETVNVERVAIVPEATTEAAFKQAVLLTQSGDLEGALTWIYQNEDQLNDESALGKQWVSLFIEVSRQLHDTSQLVLLYRHFPQAFERNEQASLLVANAFLSSYDNDSYALLRSKWKNHETHEQEWLLHDVDALLMANQKVEAIQLLQSKSFQGTEESGRLVRLALLNIVDNPKAAWDYLTEASVRDPHNPDIHTYRARLLESVGKKALAQTEYVAALQTDPENIFLKDQLGDFYLRNGQFQSAMSVWLDTFAGVTLDSILLKVLFWSHVMQPIDYHWASLTPPSGKLQALNRYLMRLNPGEFWNESSFTQTQGAADVLATQQATFWLRLLDFLQKGKEDQALALLQTGSFGSQSWNASLENALTQIIVYRKTGLIDHSTDVGNLSKKKWSDEIIRSPLFTALETLAQKQQQLQSQERKDSVPHDLEALLKSPEVFTVALISAGWVEAGLQLHREGILSKEVPSWVAPTIAEAILANRGHIAALKYVMMQPVTPELSQMMARLLKDTKNSHLALNELKIVAQDPAEAGMRASWTMSLIYIERGDYANAKKAIESHPYFANSVLGRETLARIALYEGKAEEADILYQSIVESSHEAKSYLARKAFNEQNWEKARILTQELLQLYPDNALLQENLRKIQALESHA